MPRIELKNISKHILNDLSLTVKNKEVVALVGPNGAGKSTVLNVIAGLIDYKGEVFFDGRRMDHIPPSPTGHRISLSGPWPLPHLTVAANIAYGLRVQGYEDTVVATRVDEAHKSPPHREA